MRQIEKILQTFSSGVKMAIEMRESHAKCKSPGGSALGPMGRYGKTVRPCMGGTTTVSRYSNLSQTWLLARLGPSDSLIHLLMIISLRQVSQMTY